MPKQGQQVSSRLYQKSEQSIINLKHKISPWKLLIGLKKNSTGIVGRNKNNVFHEIMFLLRRRELTFSVGMVELE